MVASTETLSLPTSREHTLPIETLRAAMQDWLNGGGGELDGDNLTPRLAAVLADVSLAACVQWGLAQGWWDSAGSGIVERRTAGLSRLRGWFGTSSDTQSALCDWADPVVHALWRAVTLLCEQCSEQPGEARLEPSSTGFQKDWNGFERLVTAFENGLQVVGRIGEDGRAVLSLGKANTAHARRRSGSYYTPHRIVDVVLEQTLERRVREMAVDGKFDTRVRVLDPACGAGLFLVRAACRITEMRRALGSKGEDVSHAQLFTRTVRENIFGVDMNPWAVDWCRLWLWVCAGDADLPLQGYAPNVRVGNALLGALTDYWKGAPDSAWLPVEGDDKREAKRLERTHGAEVAQHRLGEEPPSPFARKLFADGWCAAFLAVKQADVVRLGFSSYGAPTYGELSAIASRDAAEVEGDYRPLDELSRRYRLFHWSLEFREVIASGGFDVIVGNPPWIAHAGRASQPLDPRVKHYFACNYRSFKGYPATHSLFVERAVQLLALRGRLGFVLPASVSELGGYEPVRRIHDGACDFDAELPDFGEGAFEGVTQPCMALISRRREGGRSEGEWGSPWPVARDDLDEVGRALLARLASLPPLDARLFGERGVQSDGFLKQHLSPGKQPHGRFTTPLREGSDIRAFELGPPRLWADWDALGRRVRRIHEYAEVKFVVRQTASYTIATLYDGLPFRNSLLAGFGSATWPPEALVALLNSSLVRWHHYMRHRDARQPVLPQVKISHLRSIPAPPSLTVEQTSLLIQLTKRLSSTGETPSLVRDTLESLVAELYGLSVEERELVQSWMGKMLLTSRRKVRT